MTRQLSSTDFERINQTVRRTAHRFKVFKTRGAGGEYVNIDGTNDTQEYDAAETGQILYIQAARDNCNNRNRTILLHQVSCNTTNAVVSIIDHNDDNSVVSVHKGTAPGWPTGYTNAPIHMLYDCASNYIYLSVPGDGNEFPAVFRINAEARGEGLEDCCNISTSDAFLNTEVWDHSFPPNNFIYNGQFNLLALRGNKLYCFYENGEFSGQGWQFFGYFDMEGNWTTLWVYGYYNITPGALTYPWTKDRSTGYYVLNAWDYDAVDGTLTMAFQPIHYSYGHEAQIVEIDLDNLDDMTDVAFMVNPLGGDPIPLFEYESTYEFSISPVENPPASGNYWWQSCVFDEQSFELGDTSMFEGVFQIIGLQLDNDAQGFYFENASTSGVSASPINNIINLVSTVDPKYPVLKARYGSAYAFPQPASGPGPSRLKIYMRKYPSSLIHTRNVFDASPIRQTTDSNHPTNTDSASCVALAHPIQMEKQLNDPKYTIPLDIVKCGNYYYMAMELQGNAPAGLWRVRNDGAECTQITEANSVLHSDYVRKIERVGRYSLLVASGVGSWAVKGGKIQMYNGTDLEFAFDGDSISFDPANGTPITALAFGGDWIVVSTTYDTFIFLPHTDSSQRDRSIRKWWDGTYADVIVGAGGNATLDDMGRDAGFEAVTFTHAKGQGSYELSFTVNDLDYLPWVESRFNRNLGAPGTFGGTLEDSNRIIYERGIQLENGRWEFIPEGYFFIVSEPVQGSAGIASMTVGCKGIIGAVVMRSVYEYTHTPDEQTVAAGALVTDDNLVFWYEDGGERVYDWAMTPEPTIYVDGAVVQNYTLHTAAGEVEFYSAVTGAVTADFTHYVSGTNEAEDVIICILRHANEVGGCGLDDSWFTRIITSETLTTDDDLTYYFSKNNIRNPDDYNAIYVDGSPVIAGFTWNYRAGSVTFAAPQTGSIVTGDCIYFTIQASGITLREITFSPKTQANAFDCINETCRRVAPNYICREAPDGIIECDFYSQKAAGVEDYTINDDDVILTLVSDNPAHYDLATYIISYGQAPLTELPNRCLDKTVTNQWAYAWHAGTDMQTIVDGDPATQVSAGYGRWSEGTFAIQSALIAAGGDGLPLFHINMATEYEIETIIFARGSQAENEGDSGAVCIFSIWIGPDGSNWTKLISEFHCPPGQNIEFKAGTNYDEHVKFTFIQVRLHSLGLYKHKGHTDSQLSVSEVQCYESEIIKGEAKLQTDDPAAEHYDWWGLIEKYGGHLVHVARNGQPDPALYTQEKVDQDASDILNEMKRLLAQVQIDGMYLPGIPLYSTIRVTNGAIERTVTMFLESKTLTAENDSLTGTNYP